MDNIPINIYQQTDLSKIKNVAIILCIKFSENKYRILVVQEKDFRWNTPAGGVRSNERNTNEGLFKAACREFAEETGYKLKKIKMCYDTWFVYDRIHLNGSYTRIFMNCANKDQLKFKTDNNLYFGTTYNRNNETINIACYSLETIIKTKSKYKNYCIETFNKIKKFAKTI